MTQVITTASNMVLDTDSNQVLQTTQPESSVASGVVDDFEDNDVTEYSGSTTIISTTNSALAGSFSGQLDHANGYATSQLRLVHSASGDGLNVYPSRGDTFDTVIVIDTASNFGSGENARAGVRFGWTSASTGYSVGLDANNNQFMIFHLDNFGHDILASTAATISSATEYRMEVAWQNDNTIIADLYTTSDGSNIATVSTTDSDYASGTGIGWFVEVGTGNAFDDTRVTARVDDYQITS